MKRVTPWDGDSKSSDVETGAQVEAGPRGSIEARGSDAGSTKRPLFSFSSSDSTGRPSTAPERRAASPQSQKRLSLAFPISKSTSSDRKSFMLEQRRMQSMRTVKAYRSRRGSSLEMSVHDKSQRAVRAWVDRPEVQLLSHSALVVTLFLPDIWIVANLANAQDVVLNTILTVCFVLFLIEMGLTYYARPAVYNWKSFFFWMDVIGTTSILIDITWIVGRSGSWTNDGTTLRVARLAKLGAKSSRLARLVKVFKYLRKRRSERDNTRNGNTVISRRLGNIVAQRVACLVLFLVIVSPFLQVSTYDYSFRSMSHQLAHFATHQHPSYNFTAAQWASTLDSYWDFYQRESARDRFVIAVPLEVEVEGLAAEACPTGQARVNYEASTQTCRWDWRSRSGTVRAANRQSYKNTGVRVQYNITRQQREDAAAAMVLIVMVVLLLLSFSASFQSAVEDFVVDPIQRMIDKLKQTASDVMDSMQQLQGEEDEAVEGEEAAMTETDMLELMVNKLARVVGRALSNSVDQLVDNEQVDEHTSKWLNEYSNEMGTGTYKRRITAGSSSTTITIDPIGGMIGGDLPVSMDVLNSFQLDVLALEPDQLHLVMRAIYQNFQLEAEFSIEPAVMAGFLKRVQGAYRKEPTYHTWYHGVDVAHTTYRLVVETKADRFFDKSEIFALITAAVAHDVNHPGFNNGFLVKTADPLAIKYNDKSPLENMHCATLYEILREDECNIMKGLSTEMFAEVRKQVLACILNTDMAFHVKNMGELQNFYELHGTTVLDFMDGLDASQDVDLPDCLHDKKHRVLLQESFLHCADLSNPIKPLPVYRKWVDRVVAEFFNQGDAEKGRGMAPSPMCDRDTTNVNSMQVNFIDFVIVPMFSCVFMLFPKYLLVLANNLRTNHSAYVDARVAELPAGAEEADKMIKRKAALEEKLAFLDFSLLPPPMDA